MLHLLIPAAGDSRRFAEAGYTKPKGLLMMKWRGKRRTMIEHVVEGVSYSIPPVIGCKPEDMDAFRRALPKEYVLVPIKNSIGQADTVCRLACSSGIDDQDSLLVVNSDNAFCIGRKKLANLVIHSYLEPQNEQQTGDVGAVVFKATAERYGYINSFPQFTYGVEKKSISNYALAGAFFFRRKRILMDAWHDWYRSNREAAEASLTTIAEPYLSSLFARMPVTKYAIEIERAQLHEWGTPQTISEDKTVAYIERPMENNK